MSDASTTTTISSLLTPGNITFILGLLGVLYTVYRNVVQNPGTNATKLEDRVSNIEKVVQEIKETHLRTVEQDIKNLTTSVNELSKTVVRLATIIDERIPKGSVPIN